MTLQRALPRLLVLALLCALAQGLTPTYALATASLAPLSLALGLAGAAALARGLWTLPAALLGVAVGALTLGGLSWRSTLAQTVVLGLQAAVFALLMQRFAAGEARGHRGHGAGPYGSTSAGSSSGYASGLSSGYSASGLPSGFSSIYSSVGPASGLLTGSAAASAAGPASAAAGAAEAGTPAAARASMRGAAAPAAADDTRLDRATALDNRPRIQALVGVAAPAAALLGVLANAGVDALRDLPPAASSWSWLALALGRLLADWAGLLIVSALALCWLGRPVALWRARRVQIVPPLLALLLLLLLGVHEVAQRDERRLDARFASSAADHLWRVQLRLGQTQDLLAAVQALLASAATQGQTPSASVFDPMASAWMRRLPGLMAAGWLQRDGDGYLWQADGRREQPTAALQRRLQRGWQLEQRPGAWPMNPGSRTDTDLLLVQAVAASQDRTPALAFVVLRPEQLLAAALPAADDPNLRACLTDTSAPTAPHRLAGAHGCESAGLGVLTRAYSQRVLLADRPLRLLIGEPLSADERFLPAAWLLALPTTLGGGLLVALLLAITGRLARIEERVSERTAALRNEVAERRQTETALVESELRFRTIFNSVGVGLTLVDNQGRITMVNPAFCTMMGCRSDELVGRPLAEIRLPDVAPDDGTAVALAGASGVRQRYLTIDRRVLQVAAGLHRLVDGNGAPAGTLGVLQDLTQMLRLRDAERERDQAATERRLQREFMGRLSAELRTPLNAIMGFAQLLSRRELKPGAAAQKRALEQIRSAGWQLLDMVNDVMDLSRIESGTLRLTLEPVSLPELVQQAHAAVAAAAQQRGVAVELSLDPDAEWAQADVQRLRQMLTTLLNLALQRSRAGDRVYLRVRPAPGPEALLIDVLDSGPALSDEELGQLFVPLHGSSADGASASAVLAGDDKGMGAGIGLGLAICRQLAERMHGRLEAHSRTGHGLRLSLQLPRAGADGDEGSAREELPAGLPLGASAPPIGRLLCITPRDEDAALVQRILTQRPGLQLQRVHTAAQALSQAAEADLLLLDLSLPDQDGLSLLRQLRQQPATRHTPVLAMSDDNRPARIDDCFDAGATDYIGKPLDATAVLRALDLALRAI